MIFTDAERLVTLEKRLEEHLASVHCVVGFSSTFPGVATTDPGHSPLLEHIPPYVPEGQYAEWWAKGNLDGSTKPSNVQEAINQALRDAFIEGFRRGWRHLVTHPPNP